MTIRPPAPGVSAPRHAVPAGACDTHTHVFGGPEFAAGSAPYALPDASLEVHAAMRDRLGIARAVLVQPARSG